MNERVVKFELKQSTKQLIRSKLIKSEEYLRKSVYFSQTMKLQLPA